MDRFDEAGDADDEDFGVRHSRKLYTHVQEDSYDIVEFEKLLKLANCNWRSRELRETVLMKTARLGFFELVKTLMTEKMKEGTYKKQKEESLFNKTELNLHADPFMRDADGYDAMMHAAENGWLSIMCLLNGELNDLVETPIKANDAHLLTKNKRKGNTLMLAAANGHMHILWYIHCKDPKYPVDEVDSQGHTALTLAIAGGHLPCVEFLVDVFKAKLTQPDHVNGWIPIHYAFYYKREKILMFLIKRLLEIEWPKLQGVYFKEENGVHDYEENVISREDSSKKRLHYRIHIVANLKHRKDFIQVRPTVQTATTNAILQETARMNEFVQRTLFRQKKILDERDEFETPCLLETTCLDVYNSWSVLDAFNYGLKLLLRSTIEEGMPLREKLLDHKYKIREKEAKLIQNEIVFLEDTIGDILKFEEVSFIVKRFVRLSVVAMYKRKDEGRRTATYLTYINELFRSGMPQENIALARGDMVQMIADVDQQKIIEYRFATILGVELRGRGKGELLSITDQKKIRKHYQYLIRVSPVYQFSFTIQLNQSLKYPQLFAMELQNKICVIVKEQAIALDVRVKKGKATSPKICLVTVQHQAISCPSKNLYEKLIRVEREFLRFYFGVRDIVFEKNAEYKYNEKPKVLEGLESEEYQVFRSHVQPLKLATEASFSPHHKDIKEFTTEELLELDEIKNTIKRSKMNRKGNRDVEIKDNDQWNRIVRKVVSMVHELSLEREESELRKYVNDGKEASVKNAIKPGAYAILNYRLAESKLTRMKHKEKMKHRRAALEHSYFAVKRFRNLYNSLEEGEDGNKLKLHYLTALRDRIMILRAFQEKGSPKTSSKLRGKQSIMDLEKEEKRLKKEIFSTFEDSDYCERAYDSVRQYLPGYPMKCKGMTITPKILVEGVLSFLHLDKVCEDKDLQEKILSWQKDQRHHHKFSTSPVHLSGNADGKKQSEELTDEILEEIIETHGEISTLLEWLKDPAIFAEEVVDKMSDFFESEKSSKMLLDSMLLGVSVGATNPVGGDKRIKAGLMSQNALEMVKYISDLHKRVSRMWKHWLILHQETAEMENLGNSLAEAKETKKQVEFHAAKLVSDQWSEDFKTQLTIYLAEGLSREMERLLDLGKSTKKKEDQDDGDLKSFAEQEMERGSILEEQKPTAKGRPQHEAILYLVMSVLKILKTKPVSSTKTGINVRALLVERHKTALQSLKDERADLEKEWLKSKAEFASSLFDAYQSHERQAGLCAKARDQQNLMRKAVNTLVEAYAVDPRPVKKLATYEEAYNKIKKEFENITQEKPLERHKAEDLPDYADRFKIDGIYALDHSKYIEHVQVYPPMKTWRNREVLDWAFDMELHKTNPDVIDCLRDRIRDKGASDMKEEIRITGYHLIKYTVNLKYPDEKLKDNCELSWRDLLHEEKDVVYLADLIRKHMKKEFDDQTNKKRHEIINKTVEHQVKRDRQIRKNSPFWGIFNIFSFCTSPRSQYDLPPVVDEEDDDDEYDEDSEEEGESWEQLAKNASEHDRRRNREDNEYRASVKRRRK
mmetsp:Transcript_10695/g.17220  ORF Transcript_10695/g.17220 Transcript_10695/m.17220 type:complete len:1535 (+) Transcript_10695:176-4780(+)